MRTSANRLENAENCFQIGREETKGGERNEIIVPMPCRPVALYSNFIVRFIHLLTIFLMMARLNAT